MSLYAPIRPLEQRKEHRHLFDAAKGSFCIRIQELVHHRFGALSASRVYDQLARVEKSKKPKLTGFFSL